MGNLKIRETNNHGGRGTGRVKIMGEGEVW